MTMNKRPKAHGFRTNTEKVRSRASKMESGGLYWNPKEGKNRIRILPPWNDRGIFYLESALHYGFRDDTGTNRAYPCLRKLGEAKCPACQVVARFKGETDPDLKKVVQQMKAKGKWFMNVIDRKAEIAEVRIFGAGFKVASAILGYFSDEDYGDITDPEEGRDITVEREGTGFTTSYSVRPGAKPTPIGVEGWEGMLHDLDTEAIRETIDGSTMLAMLKENYPELDLDGIIVGKPAKTAKVVEEEEPEEEEEDETPAPKKVVKKKVVKKAEEEENLDDDEDEDDD